MNTLSNRKPPAEPETTATQVPKPSGYRDGVRYRERDYGTGYGRSSGYARDGYANSSNNTLFRCG